MQPGKKSDPETFDDLQLPKIRRGSRLCASPIFLMREGASGRCKVVDRKLFIVGLVERMYKDNDKFS